MQQQNFHSDTVSLQNIVKYVVHDKTSTKKTDSHMNL